MYKCLCQFVRQATMSTPPAKRKRVEVSASLKKDICLYKDKNPKATLAEIGTHFQTSHGHNLGRSTISDILKARDKWINVAECSGDLTRARHAKHDRLEKALFLWLGDMNSQNAVVNDEMLIEKAKKLGFELQVSDFAYSRGWLARFKSRHGLTKRIYAGESGSVNRAVVAQGREDLALILADYDLQDIFNKIGRASCRERV